MKLVSFIKQLIFVFLSLVFHSPVMAEERILSFHSDIHVLTDGSMNVEETIFVSAEQEKIRRGIYRDFPTRYRDKFGNRYRVDFRIVSIQRDSENESYSIEEIANGVRVYIGQQNVILPAGEYVYTITYTTDRQLGYFENYDELYWNVTGNGWDFPINKASARVFLPEGIPDSRVNAIAYTGVTGSEQQAFRENRYSGGTVFIESSRELQSHEGLTIVIGWPKGYVIEPTLSIKLGYFYKDNRHLIVAAIGLIVLVIYYLFVWILVGKDPKKDVIIARYSPPDKYSPASLRYIEYMGYDDKCFATAIINLAVKGYLTISENDGEYTLTRTNKAVKMAAGEKALVNKLFSDSTSKTFKQSNHTYIKKALNSHEASLRRDYETKYFVTNSGYFLFGMLITAAVVISTFLVMPDISEVDGTFFIILWLSGWSISVFFLIISAIQKWRRAKDAITIFSAIYASIFAAIFTIVEIFVITIFARDMSWSMLVIILAVAGINWLFYELLKAPTHLGRILLDKVEGFRLYLEVAEKQELEARHTQGRCPELFETYLPYALALGVEQSWAEKFSDVLVKVSAGGDVQYHPTWYSGQGWYQNHIGDFSLSLGKNFTNAISSSSSPPGSSSGGGGFSGGGGSSGGGGGGGGGGGW